MTLSECCGQSLASDWLQADVTFHCSIDQNLLTCIILPRVFLEIAWKALMPPTCIFKLNLQQLSFIRGDSSVRDLLQSQQCFDIRPPLIAGNTILEANVFLEPGIRYRDSKFEITCYKRRGYSPSCSTASSLSTPTNSYNATRDAEASNALLPQYRPQAFEKSTASHA